MNEQEFMTNGGMYNECHGMFALRRTNALHKKRKDTARGDDARLSELKVKQKCMHTKVSYKLTMYDEKLQQKVNMVMSFQDVVVFMRYLRKKKKKGC